MSSATAFEREVFAVLLDYLSAPNCHAVIRSCESIAKAKAGRLAPQHLPALLQGVERALDGFGVVGASKEACRERLRSLGFQALADITAGDAITIPISQPEDILHARRACRNVCRKIGFSDVTQTKVVTAVSELVRIILACSGEGRLEIRRVDEAWEGIELVARDLGLKRTYPPAAFDEEELERTGTGAPLLGVRRLMDHLDVISGHGRGTILTARMLKG